MGATTTLEATAREGTGKGAARTARRNGLVPGVIYGGGEAPQPINVKFNELLKLLKKGKFLSSLHNVVVDGKDNRVICRAVQRDVVKDMPTHVDFQRLSERSRIKLFIPVEFLNQGTCPGLKRGGTLNVVRHEVELNVTAGSIPDRIEVDLGAAQLNDVIKISAVTLPAGVTPTITDRDFVICSIATPSGFVDAGEEGEGEEAAEA
ncbi:50S ribosomal protein L25/general stress protein Ctc [Rubrimonas cliftonensis]|uniref:Large ribosomal subunit protein bL25 n=1 Tax=Rubrimonas cliftonensis TaxID=89524 RepID=A0A1H3X1P6_9RHOB|nr:50S ribosomal protein L25/general stress protein Ctc [Rubrimonas cliftonensis]SDZ92564.1 LSU ribosomal protein L25P [Rubrimonas cliftonensis]